MKPPTPGRAGKAERWSILCIGFDGGSEYVMAGPPPGRVAIFFNKREAQESAEFLKMGVEEDYQSINVVRAPRVAR